MQKCRRFKIILISDLPPEEAVSMGMTPVASFEEAIKRAELILNKDYNCYIIPDGGVMLPVMRVQ
jgi:lactate racemase